LAFSSLFRKEKNFPLKTLKTLKMKEECLTVVTPGAEDAGRQADKIPFGSIDTRIFFRVFSVFSVFSVKTVGLSDR